MELNSFNYPLISIPEEEVINGWDTFPDIDMDRPWTYKGWRIWKWTGWKGNWVRRNPHCDSPTPICKACGKAIELWDLVYISQGHDGCRHAECKPEYHGEIAGQWLAIDSTPPKDNIGWDRIKYLYSSAPGGEGLYARGACFDLSIGDKLTYYTDLDILEQARQDALNRMYAFIDNYFRQEYPDANL
jgi:hypothetical protein